MSLRDLYHEMIVDHGKQPRHFGSLVGSTHQHAGHNPLCGDKLMVYVKVANDVIEDISFQGAGCAISVASASLMTESVLGKTLVDVTALFHLFHELVTQGKVPEESVGKLAALGGVAEFPARVKCATLAWHTLNAALANHPDTVSTE